MSGQWSHCNLDLNTSKTKRLDSKCQKVEVLSALLPVRRGWSYFLVVRVSADFTWWKASAIRRERPGYFTSSVQFKAACGSPAAQFRIRRGSGHQDHPRRLKNELLFSLLPSGKERQTIKSRWNRLKQIYFPLAVKCITHFPPRDWSAIKSSPKDWHALTPTPFIRNKSSFFFFFCHIILFSQFVTMLPIGWGRAILPPKFLVKQSNEGYHNQKRWVNIVN